jgi:hypothetical protein
MKVAIEFLTPKGAFSLSLPFDDVEGFQPAVVEFLSRSLPYGHRINCAVAFGFAWGAYINGVTDADNPLSISAVSEDCRCTTQIVDADLEAIFGVRRS